MPNKLARHNPTVRAVAETDRTGTNHHDVGTALASPVAVSRLRPGMQKPFTTVELQARNHGQAYLTLAQSYRAANDVLNAICCCLEGLALTFGISRPLAVRDQLQDLLGSLDPCGTVSYKLRMCMDYAARQRPSESLATSATTRVMPKHLERLVSSHQLLTYPSEYRRFNRAYDDAVACLKQNPSIREFYIVQYRIQLPELRYGGELHFAFVPAALISRDGPYYLTDICAVVRN